MKLGYDLQPLYTGSNKGGIGRYCYHFLNKMFELYPQNEYVLFTNGLHTGKKPFPESDNISYKTVHYLPGHDLDPINGLLQYANYYANDLDLMHILSPVEFKHDSVVMRDVLKGKTVLILWDLIPLRFSPLYLGSESTRQEYRDRIKMINKADLLLSISECSRKDAIALLNIPAEKIVNIGIAPTDEFFHVKNLECKSINAMKDKYGISDHFILHVGSIDVRKNVTGLIEAYAKLPSDLIKRYSLVIACNYTESSTRHLKDFAKNETSGKVQFLHFIPDDDLNVLYNLCDLFVFPSLYEGGGLPVLEAMKCGAPVIAGNNSSIPEIMGRMDNLFVSENPESITRLMIEVLTNDVFANELRGYGISQAKQFTWDRVVTKAMDAYKQYLNSNNNARPQKQIILMNREEEDLHIGLITTWNTKCGIANYSKYLTQNTPKKGISYTILARKEQVIVGEDKANVSRCWLNRESIEQIVDTIKGSDIQLVNIMFNYSFFTVSQLGNLILRIKEQNIKVIVTIHDVIENRAENTQLKDIVVELNLADTIIVFSEDHIQQLKNYGVSTDIINFPQGILRQEDEDRYALRKLNGITNSKILASAGFLLPHKGILEVITALPALLNSFPDILYLVVCSLHLDPSSQRYYEECKDAVKKLKLDGHVRFFVDYLEEEEVMKILHLADILVLPYQHTGQPTSAGLRFALSALRPVITTNASIFSDFEHEVYKISDCNSKLIAEAVIKLYGDKELRDAIMEASTQRIESESWESIAQKYVDITRKCRVNSSESAFKWIRLIDKLSQSISQSDIQDKEAAIDILSKEIYKLQFIIGDKQETGL